MSDRLLALAGSMLLLAMLASAAEYHVAPTGHKDNDGSASSPFRDIQHAAGIMEAGDRCVIHAGTYREEVVPAAHGVSFIAAPGDTVVVSGFEPVTDWSRHDGEIYAADLGFSDLGDLNQVLVDGRIMNLARWPNKTNFNPFDLEAVNAWGTTTSISHAGIPDWGWEHGGVVWYLGKSRWTSWRVPATGATAGTVYFDTLPGSWDYAGSHSPARGGELILMNILEALDSAGEWYIDRATDSLYIQLPGGGDPDDAPYPVLARARSRVLNLAGKTGVVIDGLTFEGGYLDLRGATECLVKNCRIYYGNHSISTLGGFNVSDASIRMNNGTANCRITRNDIQWGAGSGVSMYGSGNLVDNNHIGNFNYLGSYASPVKFWGDNQLSRNQIWNAGRDGILGGGNGSDCSYNDIHHTNLINDDCGGVYFNQNSFGFTRLHHNWIHDIESRDTPGLVNSYKGTGIYLDTSPKEVIVDHNVLWNLEWACIQINWQGEDLLIYNNTLWSNGGANSKSMGRWVNGYPLYNVPLYNTLANEGSFVTTDQQNTVLYPLHGDPFENMSETNFIPKADSLPIDAGRIISGITDGFVREAPDVGAYERGGFYWVPGPDWPVGQSVTDDMYRPLVGLYLAQGNGTLLLEELTPFANYRIEVSTNAMASWSPLVDFSPDITGTFSYLPPGPLEESAFYRVIELLPSDPPYSSGGGGEPGSGVMTFDDFVGQPQNHHVDTPPYTISAGLPDGLTVSVGGDANGFGVIANATSPPESVSVPGLYVYGDGATGSTLQFSQDVEVTSLWTSAASWALNNDPGGQQRITGRLNGVVVWTYNNTTAHTDFWEVTTGVGHTIDEITLYPKWVGIDNISVTTSSQ